MFSQKRIDEMDILELVRLIKTVAGQAENCINFNAHDANDYCEALINLTQNLSERINLYIED